MIYLVRHGESDWNVTGRAQGQAMAPVLTERGQHQAQIALAAILADLGSIPVTRVVTSDLTRAAQTAEIIATGFGLVAQADSRLQERSLGELEGLATADTVAAVRAVDWSDPDLRIGGGESTAELYDRLAAVSTELDGDEVVIAVSHGDAIRAVLALWAGLGPGQDFWADVPNGSIVVLVKGQSSRWLPIG